MKSISTPKTV